MNEEDYGGEVPDVELEDEGQAHGGNTAAPGKAGGGEWLRGCRGLISVSSLSLGPAVAVAKAAAARERALGRLPDPQIAAPQTKRRRTSTMRRRR